MIPDPWAKAKEIVADALEHQPQERTRFLDLACAGDKALRQEVESLLAHESENNPLDDPAPWPLFGWRGPSADEVLANRFQIIRLIGQGGMGSVYAAQDLHLGERVALKIIRPEIAWDERMTARFKKEIQLAKRVTHPNVCRIYDLGYHGTSKDSESGRHEPGILFLTMELLEGRTLAERLQKGRMSTAEALPIVLQMATGLGAAHDVGVVHRDFKAGNVILVPSHNDVGVRVVITDFGLARPTGRITTPGEVVGTPDYMAPEQLTGGPVTPAIDIYALGIVMYQILTGTLPFQGDTPFEAALKRLHAKPQPPRQLIADLDPKWERVILRCLNLKPEERFQKAAEVAATLSGKEPSTALTIPCPSCNRENPSKAAFCDGCGARLKRSWIVGSASDCHVILQQDTVSGHHCRITETNGGFFLEDLNSTNGTFVNGRRMETTVLVTRADAITLGRGVPFPWDEIGTDSKVLRVGRGADNDIFLDHPVVSRYHARITIAGGSLTVEDLGSAHGTAIGNPQNKITKHLFSTEDTIYFGSIPVPAARLLSGKVVLGEGQFDPFQVSGDSILFGRDSKCQKCLNHPMISAYHARLSRSGDGFTIEDLGSTNGTFVNGHRVSGSVRLSVGDTIALGTYTFRFSGGSTFQERDHRGNVTIEAKGVTVDVPGRRLIEDVSLTIFPSEMVGLMGMAGAGKTTLMSALNGYQRPTSGNVFINGEDLYRHFERFRGEIGYVPQDDIMHPDLTVGQALYFTAKLRLPSDSTDADIRTRVRSVLELLSIVKTEDTRIGSPERRGISGGERKRVNIAMELLTDPDVLFLDEPTTGLSSEDAFMVMKALRELADRGKTVFLVIHQPSLDIFKMLDSIVVVAQDKDSKAPGKMVYFGPAHPDGVNFFNPEVAIVNEPSPEDMLRGLGRRPVKEWLTRYSVSEYKREFVDQRSGKLAEKPSGDDTRHRNQGANVGQWWILVRRCLAIKLQDKTTVGVFLGMAIFIGCLFAFLFEVKGDRNQYLAMFLLLTASLFFGLLNGSRELVAERAVYRRERMVNLAIPSYIASKFTVLGSFCAIQTAIMFAITYHFANLHGNILWLLFVLVVTSLVGLGYGLIISSISPTAERANFYTLPVLMLTLVLGGLLLNLSGSLRLVSAPVASSWAFEAMLHIENEEFSWVNDASPDPEKRLKAKMNTVENHFSPDSQFDELTDISVLSGMVIALMALLAIILKSREDIR